MTSCGLISLQHYGRGRGSGHSSTLHEGTVWKSRGHLWWQGYWIMSTFMCSTSCISLRTPLMCKSATLKFIMRKCMICWVALGSSFILTERNKRYIELIIFSCHCLLHVLQLRVREHQVLGPYVEDLSTYVAASYTDIEVSALLGVALLDVGTYIHCSIGWRLEIVVEPPTPPPWMIGAVGLMQCSVSH